MPLIERTRQFLITSEIMTPSLQGKLLLSVVVLLLLWMVRVLILRVVARKAGDNVRSLYRWRKTTNYATSALALLVLGSAWFPGFQSVGTFIGLLSAGVTIALKDLVAGLAGWAFILGRRPFEVGDRIQVGNHTGDVIDIRIFQFTLMEVGNWVDAEQSTGRIIHVPNGRILSDVLANYNKGFRFIWNEIPVLITFESDWRAAKQILLNLTNKHAEKLTGEAEQRLREAARKFMIFYSKLTPTVYTRVVDSGVLLTIRYLCKPHQRRSSEQAIWEEVLDAFAQTPSIDFAYPTQRIQLASGTDHPTAHQGACTDTAPETPLD